MGKEDPASMSALIEAIRYIQRVHDPGSCIYAEVPTDIWKPSEIPPGTFDTHAR